MNKFMAWFFTIRMKGYYAGNRLFHNLHKRRERARYELEH